MRLVPQRRVLAYPYKGYWSPADTVKERAQLEEMYRPGDLPLDGLGPGTIGHDPTGQRRLARARRLGLDSFRIVAGVTRTCCHCI